MLWHMCCDNGFVRKSAFCEGEGVSMVDQGLKDSLIEVVDKMRSFDRVVKEVLVFRHEGMESAKLGGVHDQER